IHWKPSPALSFELARPDGNVFRLADYRGRPLIVIFYLGASCLHCAEQLQAFAPQKERFEKAGLEIVAISTDDSTKLLESITNYGEKMPIPLMSNHDLEVFKKYRVYDNFEKQPLHGTFLIDEEGLVRWQDISYEPFMDHEFLYKESLRLLDQKKVATVSAAASPE
ncbi:MAG: peroxiredoxin family protein, partial [Planctomycetota bacterium]|nr:peroxiredoxin family protein [Planctomycetota bacterium]